MSKDRELEKAVCDVTWGKVNTLQKFSVDFIRWSVFDIKALQIPANRCRETFLEMLSGWATTPEREVIASTIPVHLFEVNTIDLDDEDAEVAESDHSERYRNLYRELFGDRANLSRSIVRGEVRDEWLVFVAIFALIYPTRFQNWSEPFVSGNSICADARRYLAAHGRRQKNTRSHAVAPTRANLRHQVKS